MRAAAAFRRGRGAERRRRDASTVKQHDLDVAFLTGVVLELRFVDKALGDGVGDGLGTLSVESPAPE